MVKAIEELAYKETPVAKEKAIILQQRETTKAYEQPSGTEEARRIVEGAGGRTSDLSESLETLSKRSSVKGGINKRSVRSEQGIRGIHVNINAIIWHHWLNLNSFQL